MGGAVACRLPHGFKALRFAVACIGLACLLATCAPCWAYALEGGYIADAKGNHLEDGSEVNINDVRRVTLAVYDSSWDFTEGMDYHSKTAGLQVVCNETGEDMIMDHTPGFLYPVDREGHLGYDYRLYPMVPGYTYTFTVTYGVLLENDGNSNKVVWSESITVSKSAGKPDSSDDDTPGDSTGGGDGGDPSGSGDGGGSSDDGGDGSGDVDDGGDGGGDTNTGGGTGGAAEDGVGGDSTSGGDGPADGGQNTNGGDGNADGGGDAGSAEGGRESGDGGTTDEGGKPDSTGTTPANGGGTVTPSASDDRQSSTDSTGVKETLTENPAETPSITSRGEQSSNEQLQAEEVAEQSGAEQPADAAREDPADADSSADGGQGVGAEAGGGGSSASLSKLGTVLGLSHAQKGNNGADEKDVATAMTVSVTSFPWALLVLIVLFAGAPVLGAARRFGRFCLGLRCRSRLG